MAGGTRPDGHGIHSSFKGSEWQARVRQNRPIKKGGSIRENGKGGLTNPWGVPARDRLTRSKMIRERKEGGIETRKTYGRPPWPKA